MNSPTLTLDGYESSGLQRTNEVIILGQEGRRIVVYQTFVSSDTAVTVTFESGGVEIWEQHVAAGGGSVVPFTGIPWFETGKGEDLTYSTSGAAQVVVAVKAAPM